MAAAATLWVGSSRAAVRAIIVIPANTPREIFIQVFICIS